MTAALVRARLLLVGGAVLVFLGGLLVAIGHWNRAEIDRAFVDAAAMAALARPAPGGVRYWAPENGELPEPALRLRIEAAERLREVPQPGMQLPALPSRPQQGPRGGAMPAEKPPAAVP